MPSTLPPVTVVEVSSVTDDGNGVAYSIDTSIGDDAGNAAEILVVAHHKNAGHKNSSRKPISRDNNFAVGDRLLVRLKLTAPNQYEAHVIRKLDRHRQQVFGGVIKVKGGFGLESIERGARSGFDLIPPDDKIPYQIGDIIEAEMVKAPTSAARTARFSRKTVKIIRNLGPADGIEAFTVLAIAEFELRHIFPDDVLASAQSAKKPTLSGREDCRKTPLITIDGADAKDFDDAVFAEPHDGGYRMLVAIADVASYVKAEGVLDLEAMKRGNSIYLPNTVIPMLPEALSNGLCSLVPNEDRACLVAEIFIDGGGNKTGHRFFRGLMRSHARLTYDEVEGYRTGGADGGIPTGFNTKHLDHLIAAYELRAKIRMTRGALDLDLPEKRVQFDNEGRAIAITKKHQTISQKLIEEFMILANVAAAETLEAAKALCIFRAHEPPDPVKIDGLRDVVKTMGIAFPKGQVITSHHFNDLLHKASALKDEAAKQLLNETVLRCQSQANYSVNNPGHFGLALRRYAHFTSPIRRYADLMVHRSLINHIKAEAITMPSIIDAAEIAQAISDTERKAAAAERRTIDRYATKLIEHDAGRIVAGKVTTIASFGAFVQIGDTGAEGLLPLNRLPDDYYDVDTTAAIITGRKFGLKIRAGDIIDVMIVEVSSLKASILLGWADDGGVTPPRKPNPNPHHRRRTHNKKPKTSNTRKNRKKY